MKFAIGIPTLNRADLLLPSLEMYIKDFPEATIHIIDNGQQELASLKELPEFANVIVHEQEFNIGVAASWNKLCKIIFEQYDWAFILNDDIYLGYGTDIVEKAIDKSRTGIVQSALNWSVFLIHKNLYNYIGEFDEDFYPAYYEDSDYMYRLKLKGILHEVDTSLNPKRARVSGTYDKNPALVNAAMERNRLLYMRKWGNCPLLEVFTHPYNK